MAGNELIKAIKTMLLLAGLSGCWLVFNRPELPSGFAQSEPWTPNGAATNARYVGGAACAQCHRKEAGTQAASAMAHAMTAPADAPILKAHPRLSFRNGKWLYQITRSGNRSVYTITDGTNTVTEPILWVFGQGVQGQTYIIRREGVYYETRVSFFSRLKSLDFTPGAPRDVPESLSDAIGQRLSHPDTMACFGCHATVAPGAPRFQLDHFTPGVSCEACHGPGEKHIAAMKSGRAVQGGQKSIFNPRLMHPDEMSQQFCGACHRSWETVMQMPERGGGMSNVRFQPYRLANSKCYQNPDDRRISCTACHDPHEDPRHDAAFYDAKCMACHLSNPSANSSANPANSSAKDRNAPPCPTSQSQCASCHMPKIEPPGLHFKFTDHHIRVVKPNEPYPY